MLREGNRRSIEGRQTPALAVGTWDTTRRVLGIPYSAEMKVLGFCMTKTIAQFGNACWARITTLVRTQAREAYSSDLGLSQHKQYVHAYLLAKLWHTAQIFPAPRECVRQIVSALTGYVWKGVIFRVHISTLQRRKKDGDGV